MKIKFIPDYRCVRPTDIAPEFFLSRNIKLVLCDLDNTLAIAQSKKPPEETILWVNKLKESGLSVAVISNAVVGRVKKFSKALNVPYLGSAMKPHRYKIRKFVASLNFKPEEVAFVGDQMFTDIECAKKLGYLAILCEIISKKEAFWTYSNRRKDEKVRKIIEKEKSVPLWSQNI